VPPRRWNEQLGGIYWLPRLVDKARAALAGTLGDYLYGQSPMDRGLLRALGVSHREFAVIVKSSPDDAAVLLALRDRDGAALDRARAWSQPLPRQHRLFFWFVDIDDGYRGTGALRAPVRFLANRLSRTVKRLWPSKAAARAAETQ